MSEVEALVARVESARAEQIERMPKTSDDLKSTFPSADAAFQTIFLVATGSGRLDAVIDCQDFIGGVALMNPFYIASNAVNRAKHKKNLRDS